MGNLPMPGFSVLGLALEPGEVRVCGSRCCSGSSGMHPNGVMVAGWLRHRRVPHAELNTGKDVVVIDVTSLCQEYSLGPVFVEEWNGHQDWIACFYRVETSF